jgi:hypothetical protein
MMLARLACSGDLTAVRGPDAADEAVRDLARAREDAVRECRNARHRLEALLLRNGITYAGKTACTAAHLRWHHAEGTARGVATSGSRSTWMPQPKARRASGAWSRQCATAWTSGAS